jgi:hypothetical protein
MFGAKRMRWRSIRIGLPREFAEQSTFPSAVKSFVLHCRSQQTSLKEGVKRVRKNKSDSWVYAINSTSELEYHLLVCRDLGKVSERDFNSLLGQLVEVRKMLYGLANYLSGQ